MKMLANADVDDTTEFWEGVYDSIRTQILQEVKDKMPKEKEVIYDKEISDIQEVSEQGMNAGWNNYRSQMLEIIDKEIKQCKSTKENL